MVSFSTEAPTSLVDRTTISLDSVVDAKLHDIIVCLNQYLIRKKLLEQQEETIRPEMREEEEDSVGSFVAEKDQAWVEASDDDEDMIDSDTPWIDVPKPFTIVTFDQATHDAWDIAKKEITTIRNNLKDFLRLGSIKDYTLRAMVEYIIERLWRVVDVSLNHHRKCYSTSNPLTIDDFKKIFSTFFIASSFGISTENLFADKWISKDDLSTKEEYIRFWKACADRDTDRYDPSSVYFWQKLLDEVNELCRDLFLNNWAPYSQKHVTIDDDKVHYNARGMGYSNTSGLKPSQFVRDNRKGFTFHTLVLTASGIPLGLEPELVTDCNSSDTSMRLITRQLAPCHRSTNIPNLSNIVIYADRLYWTKSFLYNFIIPSGADIGPCTHKRTHHFPFTYEQKLTRNDNRILIPKKGSKCIMLKQQKIGSHILSAIAYRDGYGKIAMGLTSSGQVSIKQWDFHLSNPDDRYKLLDEDGLWSNSLCTWIQNIEKEKGLSDTFVNLFSSTCRVKGITTKGSDDQAWFIARGFSFTSSTSDKILNAVYELVRKNQTGIDQELVDKLNIILEYLNKVTINVVSSDVEGGGNLPIQDDATGSDIPVETDIIIDGCNVSNELRLVKQNQGESTNAFLQRLNNPREFSDEAVKSFLNLLGASSVKSRHSNCQKIIEWINLRPIEKRNYYFLKKAALVDSCVRELGGSKTSYSKQSVDELVDLLAQPQSIHASDTNSYPVTTPRETPTSSLSETLLKEIVKGSVLKPLSGSGRQETRMGLDNELPLLSRLLEESKGAKTLIIGERVASMHLTVSEIYRTGMARKIDMEYAKTSIDALGVVVGMENGEAQQLIGIELKTRVTEKTRRPEIELRSNLQMGHKFVKINYKLAKRFIPSSHECLQILHHAFVYDLSMVLLVIGDIKSTILRGVLVEFDEEMLTTYRNFLSRCYDQSLKWAYDTPDYTNLINQHSEDDASLNFIRPLLPSGVDFDSFIDYYKLWKCSTSDDQRLPLPSTEYIVPYHFSKWNKFKGGSDTLTKLFWNGKHYVPHLTPGSNAVSHLFRFIAGLLRRIDAVMGSKEDLALYSSLYAWRHANNERQTSYQVFARQIARCLLERDEAPGTSIVTPPRVLGRSSRNRIKEVEAKWAEGATGKTPARRVKERYETDLNIDQRVVQRREMCSGNIICRVALVDGKLKTDGKGVVSLCAECGMKTRFFCAQCRVPLCGPAKICNDENGQPKVHFMDGPNQKRIQFLRSCSHIYHEKGLMMEKEMRTNTQSESSEDEDSF